MKIKDFFQLFSGHSLSYDDLIFLPSCLVDFGIEKMDLSVQLSDEIKLQIPVISSPMDTVTEANLAIGIALQGGLGMIHYNMDPVSQEKQVKKVKNYQNGFVSDPIALPPTATIRDVLRIRREQGYSTIPITADGTPHGKLVGMITKYDYSTFNEDSLDKMVSERMVVVENLEVAIFEDLVCGGVFDLAEANQRLLDSHSAALPILDRKGNMRYLITRSDIEKHQNYPFAAMDRNHRLLVGAAVETWPEKAYERIERLQDCVDVIVFDTSQGYSRFEIELIKWTKERYPHLQIIGGNVVTKEGCHALLDAGADMIRVGMGIGSICTTQEVGGIGRGQATALYECANVCRSRGKICIADGGIKGSSNLVKALCLGADLVMLGSLLACTSEAPGKIQVKDGIRLKEYRGMGSLQAMEKGSASRYAMQNTALRIPEGVSGMVSSRGSISEWIPCLMQGVKQGLHKLGQPSLPILQERIEKNAIQLEKRSDGAKQEGRVHSLFEVSDEGNRSTMHEEIVYAKQS